MSCRISLLSAGRRLVLAFVCGWTLVAAAAAIGETPEEKLRDLEREVATLKAEVARLAPIAAAGTATDRVGELERRLEVLASELERLRLGEAAAEASESTWGLGPAASKIYRTGKGLSVGGYGELLYQGFDSQRDDGAASGRSDEIDLLRAIVYFGYKFNDRWLLNTEIEYEHAVAGEGEGGEVAVEFAYLDYLWRRELNARAGLLLMPMGLVNELHEPTVFLGARRPGVDSAILPTTWRENGFGIFGEVGPFSYRSYLLAGLDASGFTPNGGIRGGRQQGSHSKAEDLAWVGRLDYTAIPGLLVGASAYFGGSGQGLEGPQGKLSVDTAIVEAHLDWKWRGLELRALAVESRLDEVAELNAALELTSQSIGERQRGAYLQVGFDFLSLRSAAEQALIPYARWESYDTQAEVPAGFSRNPAADVEILTLGLAWRPFDQVIVKSDFQDIDNAAGTGVDQFNVALGYIF